MREFFDLGNNPLFVKHVRSRLRRSAVVPLLAVAVMLSLGLLILDHQLIRPNDPDSTFISKAFFFLQAFILFFLGGSQVASTISHINETGIIDFHRITPMPSKVQTVGILLGAPIRELMLYTVTLPFTFYAAMTGPVGIANWCKLLLVQLGAALMYYTVAMVTGMSARTGRGASGRFVALIGVLNLLAANLFYPAGIYGPALLTVVPVFEEIFPEQQRAPRGQAARNQKAPAGQVPPGGQANQQPPPREILFYSLPVPVVLQSLLFQGTFIAFLFVAASRRVRSDRLPLFAKPIALLFYGCVALLALGSVWDVPRMLQVLGLIYFLLFFGMMLSTSVTPVIGDVVKGLQRARKVSQSRVPPWSDLSTNRLLVLLFGVVMSITVALAILLSADQPLPIPLKNAFQPWPPLLVGAAVLFWFAFGLQYYKLSSPRRAGSYIAGWIVLIWVMPLIVGGILNDADDEAAATLMAASPIAGIANAGAVGFGPQDPLPLQLAAVVPSALLAVLFYAMLIVQERRLGQAVQVEHREAFAEAEHLTAT